MVTRQAILPPNEWTERKARDTCEYDLGRVYGNTLAVDSLMGKQPHKNNTTLVGLVATDSRAEFNGQQVTVGCIYKQDGSLATIFFNTKIDNWIKPPRG